MDAQLTGESLTMQRKLLGDEHAELALCLSNLATLLGVKGDYAGAESLLREALAMQRRLLGDEHPNVATSLNNLAMLLMNKGDYAAAEPPFREALEMRRKLLGDEHPDVALSLNNLAGLIQNQGNFAGAEPLYRQALATRRKLLGDKHTDVAQSLSTLAALLQSKGDYGDAEPLYCEALELFRKLLGDEHPYVASSLNNLAAFLYAKGDFAAAEPLFCEALAMRRKMLGDVHPDVALSLNNLAALHASKGDYAGAEPLLREALAIAERQRTSIVGGEAERAAFAERLQLSQITSALAYAVIRMRQPDAACEALERGHNRALLDLMARRDSDLGAETAASNPQAAQQLHLREQKEAARRIKLATAEAKIAETQSRHDLSPADKSTLIEEQLAAIRQSRRALSDATALVFESLRAVWPDAKPLTPEAIRSALSPGEVIFTYNWTRDSLSAIVVPPAAAGPVQAAVIAEGKDKIQSIRASALSAKSYISHRPGAQSPESVADPLAELHTALVTSLPADIRATIDSARRVIFLPDGPLVGIPFDLVLASGRDATSAVAKTAEPAPLPEIVYADSGTIYVNRRRQAKDSGRAGDGITALIVGDPIFDRSHSQPKYPDQGVLISMVVPESNAGGAGLSRGDVILAYDEQPTEKYEALVEQLQAVGKAIEGGDRGSDDMIALRYWRDGKELETKVAPGKLGVQLDRRPPKDGLELIVMQTRGEEAAIANVSMLDQIRLHGGSLPPLPGTAREAEAIARVIKTASGTATLLKGESATIGRLESNAGGKRILHIATHGLTGSQERPYDASLALTQPETPSPDDIGFLTLDELIRSWRGRLKDCDLVVLSACDTQRGIKKGDSMMALPWGFFYAGAPTVIASLWKVDDTATQLLMTRFYENLLGSFPDARRAVGQEFNAGTAMPKNLALIEAKTWLRNLTYDERDVTLSAFESSNSDQQKEQDRSIGKTSATAPRGEGKGPYEHPYYWAAFILIGSPT